MKKPLSIGILSVIPGLGFAVLGELRQGIIVFIIVAFFVLLGVFVPSENISITAYTLALIAWISQIYYAVLVAQRRIRLEANPTLQAMQGMAAPLASSASPGEKRLYEAKQDMLPLLVPGEDLKIALPCMRDAPSMLATLFNLIVALAAQSPAATGKGGEHIYLGVTESDFLLASTDRLLKPNALKRIPLRQVRLMAYSEGMITDEIIIDVGEAKPMHVHVGRTIRDGTTQLVALLPRPGESARPPAQSIEAAKNEKAPLASVQVKAFNPVATQPGAIKAPAFLAQAGISALGLLAGYAIGFGFLHNYFIGGNPALKKIVDDAALHMMCYLPSVIPIAIGVAAIMVLSQNRLKFSTLTARIANSIASLVLGMISYAPFQLLLLFVSAVSE